MIIVFIQLNSHSIEQNLSSLLFEFECTNICIFAANFFKARQFIVAVCHFNRSLQCKTFDSKQKHFMWHQMRLLHENFWYNNKKGRREKWQRIQFVSFVLLWQMTRYANSLKSIWFMKSNLVWLNAISFSEINAILVESNSSWLTIIRMSPVRAFWICTSTVNSSLFYKWISYQMDSIRNSFGIVFQSFNFHLLQAMHCKLKCLVVKNDSDYEKQTCSLTININE